MADRELKIRISADDRASGPLKHLGEVLRTGLGVAIGTAIVPALKALTRELGSVFTEASEAERVSTQLNAVLKSTGGIAGVTAEMATGLADSFSQMTIFEDEAILSGENLLLTFTEIKDDVFPAATEVMLDMSTALGQDLKTSAIQLGKALQDPETGMTALRRVGVNFNETAIETVKQLVAVGDTAGAQTFIIAELRREFGGAARAAGQTFAGQVAILKNNIGNLKEAIGSALLPVLTSMAREFNSFVTIVAPAVGGAIRLIVGGFGKVVEGASGWGENLGRWFANGLTKSLPYILGAIYAIRRVIAYWFAPGSPPKIADRIDLWGEAMVKEFFSAFGQVPLDDIVSLQNQITGIFKDATDFGLVSDDFAYRTFDPVKRALKAMQAEYINTGRVGEDSFEGLLKIGGPLGVSLVNAARGFFQFSDAGDAAAGAVADIGKAIEEVTDATGGATGGGGGGGGALADPMALADSLLAAMPAIGGEGAGAGPLGLDMEAITAQADGIAKGITDKLFPMFDEMKKTWANVSGAILGPLETAKKWVEDNWPTVGTNISGAMSGVKTWLDENWPSVSSKVTGALDKVQDWIALKWPVAQVAISGAYSEIKKWVDEKWPAASEEFGKFKDKVAGFLGLTWTTATELIGKAWIKVGDWLGGDWSTTATNLGTFKDEVANLFALGWATASVRIANVKQTITDWTGLDWDGLNENISTLASAAGTLLDLDWSAIKLSFGEGGLSGAAEEIKTQLKTNLGEVDWGAVALVIGDGIAAALVGTTNLLVTLSEKIKTAVTGDAAVQASLRGVGTAIGLAITGAILFWLQSDDSTPEGTNIVVSIANKLATAVTNNNESFKAVGDNIRWGIIDGLTLGLLQPDTITKINEGASLINWSLLKFSLPGLQITESVQNIIASIKEIVGYFTGSGDKKKVGSITAEEFKAVGKEMVDGLILGVKIATETATAAISAFLTAMKDEALLILEIVLPGSSELFKRIGDLTVQGLIDGIGSRVKDAKAAWDDGAEGGLLNQMVAAVKAFLKIKSPSGLFEELGTLTVDGLIKGLTDPVQTLINTFTGPEGILTQANAAVRLFFGLDGATPLFLTLGATLVGNIMSGIGSGVTDLKAVATGAVEAARLAIHDAETTGQLFFKTGGSILSWIDSGISGGVDTWAKNVWETIKRAVSGAATSAPTIPAGGGGGGSGARAGGGPVIRGSSYLVGERGPELFTPGRSGMITPNDRLSGATWNVTINSTQPATRIVDDIRYLQALGAARA